ncbi:Hemopexin [Ancylostoma ceylanicum]|uniref:Hemopexin n=1 Tax=Ancylostoma ceylanicum TaxID=53326 RepID=A0A0D6M812_9BILA|nr:Hemopexin [Ancylostoma ceylanicum]
MDFTLRQKRAAAQPLPKSTTRCGTDVDHQTPPPSPALNPLGRKAGLLVTAWSRRLDPGNVDATITRALAEWQKHANLEFRRAQDPILNMKFGVGYHQCEYPFTSSVLAHAFRPRTTSFEPKDDPSNLIGDIHFNDDVPWSSPLLLATAIHEIGHSLGLPHVLNDVNSIMYPILVEGQQFTPHDIKTIQEMYGPPVGRGSKPSNPTQSTNRESNERRSRESEETREEEEKPDEAPRPCSSGADAITTYRGEFIVFKNKWLWRVVKDGHLLYGPNLISDIFPGIPEKIDAAVEIHGQIWIFAGSYFSPPATYLWAEDEYWKLDVRTRKVEDSYARRISLNWKHVPAGATAAFSRDKELYFIRGDLVYRMNTTDYRLPVSEGYPVSISKFWPFCEDENQSVRYASPQTSFTKALPYPLITTL